MQRGHYNLQGKWKRVSYRIYMLSGGPHSNDTDRRFINGSWAYYVWSR